MAIQINFDGKTIIEPGSYARIISGNSIVPRTSAYGKVLVIDNGVSDGFGVGAGINGELSNGKNCVYEFTEKTDFKNMVRGGLFYDLADYLFNPSKSGRGVDSIKYVKAGTTTAGASTITFTNGVLSFKTKNEGIGANGILLGETLVKGYAIKLQSGIIDVDKYRLVFYVGGFKGVNNTSPNFSIPSWATATSYAKDVYVYYNGLVWKSLQASNSGKIPDQNPTYWEIFEYSDNFGDKLPSESVAKIVAISPETDKLSELVSWCENDANFNFYFKLTSKTVTSDSIVAGDLAALSDYTTFVDATTEYNATDIDDVLANITDEDASFILTDQFGANAKSTINTKVLSSIETDFEFKKILYIGAGLDSTKFKQTDGSIDVAKYFNNARTAVVHSGLYVPKFGGGEKIVPSIYNAAEVLGRTAGLEPQVPSTWKDINMNRPVHDLNKKERELALISGVIHHRYVDGKGWVINQSVNSLQQNNTLWLPDGDSYEISIERIKMQLNKELVLNSRVLYVGGNLYSSSAEDLKAFTEGYLKSRTVKTNQDNLIMSFSNVKVVLNGDSWDITYNFVANSPINKIFFTGVSLDANISI